MRNFFKLSFMVVIAGFLLVAAQCNAGGNGGTDKPRIAFSIDGKVVGLLEGVYGDAAATGNVDVESAPNGWYVSSENLLVLMAADKPVAINSGSSGSPENYVNFLVYGFDPLVGATGSYICERFGVVADAENYAITTLTVEVTEFGQPGEFIEGTFSGMATKSSDSSEHNLIGSFKVNRLVDNAIPNM